MPETYRPRMSEDQLQNVVVDLAMILGWRVFWIPDWVWRVIFAAMKGRRVTGRKWSPPGFPDLVMVRRGRLIFAELKSAKGEVRPPQQAWADDLREVAGISYRLWKPDDWHSGVIENELNREARDETA